MKPLDRTLHLRESKRGPRLRKQIGNHNCLSSINTNHVTKEHAMTHSDNIPHYIIDTRAVARRLILLASLASASACGVRAPGGFVVGTTSFLEEYNKGVHTESFQEHINNNDRVQLEAKLQEIK
jgi:hypothetical protein